MSTPGCIELNQHVFICIVDDFIKSLCHDNLPNKQDREKHERSHGVGNNHCSIQRDTPKAMCQAIWLCGITIQQKMFYCKVMNLETRENTLISYLASAGVRDITVTIGTAITYCISLSKEG